MAAKPKEHWLVFLNSVRRFTTPEQISRMIAEEHVPAEVAAALQAASEVKAKLEQTLYEARSATSNMPSDMFTDVVDLQKIVLLADNEQQ